MADSGKLTLELLLVADLRRELTGRNQDVSGTKVILKERLRKCLIEEGVNPEDFVFVRNGDSGHVDDKDVRNGDSGHVDDKDKIPEASQNRSPAPSSVGSGVSGKSTTSSSMELEKAKRAARSAGLRARQEALAQKQKMMEEELELRQQLQREEQALHQKKELAEMSMKMKREAIELQVSMAENEAELSCLKMEGNEVTQPAPVPSQSVTLPIQVPGTTDPVSNPDGPREVPSVRAPGPTDPAVVPEGTCDAPSAHVHHGIQDALLDHLSKQISRSTLPLAEVPRFSGNVMEYRSFIRAFEARIAGRVEDAAEKLYYLDQYVTGKAKDLVKGCMHLEPSRGYDEARRMLEKRYGNPSRVVTAYMERLANWPPLKGSVPALDEFSLFLVGCKNAMEVTPGLSEMGSPQTMKMIVEKLQPGMQDRWRRLGYKITEDQRRLVKFADLVEFVEREAAIATDPVFGREEMMKDTHRVKMPTEKTAKRSSFATGVRGAGEPGGAQSSERKCYYCQGPHMLHDCPILVQKNMAERTNFIRERRLCFGCLGTGHVVSQCRRRSYCRICKKKHVTVLHDADLQAAVNQAREENHQNTRSTVRGPVGGWQRSDEVQASNAHVSAVSEGGGSMNIVPVKIFPAGQHEHAVMTYAFLDNGSSASFISSTLLAQLDVPSAQRTLTLTTVSGKKVLHTQVTGGLEVSNLDKDSSIPLPPLYTLDSLPVSREEIPRQSDADDWPHLQGISLPEAGHDVEVGLLIGYNCPKALEPLEVVRSEEGGPYAVRTAFGWTIAGPRRESTVTEGRENHRARVHRIKIDKNPDEMIRHLFNAEFGDNMSSTELGLSQEDRLWKSKIEDSVKIRDGHYELALPFRDEDPRMPNNRQMAERRLACLKRKLDSNPQFAQDYTAFMKSLVEEGHAEKVPEDSIRREDKKVWFIPHHGVYHPRQPRKIRVVFDCAARLGDVGLNDMLLQGPDLTNSLVGVLMRFRQGEVALTADVKAMFHQVKVPREDRDFLRFLWWSDGDRERVPTEYRMTVHLFGAVSSPSCANFALRKAAEDNADKFSQEAVDVIFRNFYVDDCLKSVGTEQEAKDVVREVRGICEEGGFHLTKFVANKKSVLEDLPVQDRSQKTAVGLDSEVNKTEERALGVRWKMDEDELGFSITRMDMPPTRRGILSVISSVYDPLGVAGPFLLRGKQILQDLCRREIGWDDSIPDDEAARWTAWLKELPLLAELTVARCLRPPDFGRVVRSELHHFCDASEKGYGAVSYLRQLNGDGEIHCVFLTGKSRVAPLKKITVPRLELSAATTGVRLNAMLQRELDIAVHRIVYWTDSTTVLRYVSNDKARYQTFVANRLAIIRDGSSAAQWRYVESEGNPADDASRGLDAGSLCRRARWLRGPDFLWKDETEWPKMPFSAAPAIAADDPEVKKDVSCAATTIEVGETNSTDCFIKHFSSMYRLKKAVAWLLRAKATLQERRRKKLDSTGSDGSRHDDKRSQCRTLHPLTVEELQKAEDAVIRYVQRQSFPDEMKFLEQLNSRSGQSPARNEGKLKRSSRLYGLDPFVEDGLLRVGGRLQRSDRPYESKHPVILPKRGHVTELLIRDTHETLGHQGREHVLARLRAQYWILSVRAEVRSVLKKCVSCKRRQARVVTQLMSDLPEDRITPGDPPFTNVGVDFFGPFVVKIGRRQEKRYGVIFTCLTVRAVHIEVASSLSTDSFINALRRFISRRGPVRTMRSDNGTNFVGAERELREEIEKMNQDVVHDAMLRRGIEWIFNPPGASHFGGSWERQIRSIRKILGAILGQQRLDDEGLHTLLCEVECILNSRPLTYVSSDIGDLEPLTPDHFLHLRGGAADAPGTFTCDDVYRRRWRHVQYLAGLFWTRWVREYLPTLQKRQKWADVQKNLCIDDVVLVVGEGSRGQWRLGRIKETRKDGRGLVRKAVVRIGHSEYLRPISKLVKLC